MRTLKRERGFTLIEMAAVIAVMGILFAMTATAMTGLMRSNRLAGARNTLMLDMRWARSRASAQRRTYELRHDVAGYSVVALAPTTTVLRRMMPTGVALTGVDTTTFFPWGLSEPAVITLNQGERTATVRLTAAGRVTHD